MESRNITLTICGEWLDFSPRDRKAVCKIDDLFKLTGNIPLVSYPLYNLIPEIISDENLERSFKRVMANLRNADARNGNRAMPKTIIDGIECSPRMIRYVTNKGKIFETLKNQIGNGTFRIKNLKSFLTEDGPKVRTVQAPSVIERIGSNAIMEPLENRLSSLLIKTTAASIQGRGPHGLFHQIQAAMAENPNLKYYYQSDYKGYYDSINHETLISIIKRYVGDPLLLPILENEADKMGLTIKSSERVAPISAGMDALGYVNYGSHTLLRKRIKVNAARKLSKLKSRKRRQQIIGSFKGMACHADCKHLFYILTKKNMKKFSEMGVTYTPADGKKRFPGKVTRLSDIVNIPIEIHDFETGIDTKEGENRYLVSFRNPAKQEWGKFFTASAEMKGILDQVSDIEDGFPFETIIKGEVFDGGKRKYNFT